MIQIRFRKAVIFLFCLAILPILYGQDITKWMRTYGNVDGPGLAIQQTTDGQYLIAGYTREGEDFDMFLMKIDVNGDMVSTKTYDRGGNDLVWSMQPTKEGGFILAGGTSDPSNNLEGDIWLIKINNNADTLWTKIYNISGNDNGNFAQQTTDGGYIIVGHTNYPRSDKSDGIMIKTDQQGDTQWTKTDTNAYGFFNVQQIAEEGYIMSGSYDIEDTTDGSGYNSNPRIIRTDPAGDTIWTRYYETYEISWGSPFCLTTDGGFIFTGRKFAGWEKTDVWIQKVDNQGNPIWSKTYEADETAEGHSVQQTADGGFIILANTGSYYTGGGDIWLIKTDMNGDTLWTKTFGGIEHYKGNEVEQTSDGGYIIVGEKRTTGSEADIMLIKTDENGNITNTSVDENKSEFGIRIFPNPANNLLTIEKEKPDRYSFEITSLNGQKIQSGTYAGQSQQIDISSFQGGIYLITIQSQDHVITKKFTKQ